jgi:hypothetical protein
MLLKISLTFIDISEGVLVEKIEGRKVCSPALRLAPILDPPLIMTAVQTSDGKTLCTTIGAIASRHLSPLLLASLHACLQNVEILTGCLTEVKLEEAVGDKTAAMNRRTDQVVASPLRLGFSERGGLEPFPLGVK